MEIYISDLDECRVICIREWTNENGGQWGSVDLFDELEVNWPYEYKISEKSAQEHWDCSVEMTEKEFADGYNWWADEVEDYNDRNPNSWFFGSGIADGQAMIEIANERESKLDIEWYRVET